MQSHFVVATSTISPRQADLLLPYLRIKTKSLHITILVEFAVTASLEVLRAVFDHRLTICMGQPAGRKEGLIIMGFTCLHPKSVDIGNSFAGCCQYRNRDSAATPSRRHCVQCNSRELIR